MSEEKQIDELAVVGCGPAGLSAAVNGKTTNLDLKVFGSNLCSPKMGKAPKVNNYLGFHDITGENLRDEFLGHVNDMNIQIERSKIDSIFSQKDYYTLVSRDNTYHAYAIILATGVSNTEYLEGEEDYLGRGVSYCATCDGPLFRDRKVAVIAHTEEGLEETHHLADLAEKVLLIPKFELEGSLPPNVELVRGEPVGVSGEAFVNSVELEKDSLDVEGVFIFREVTPPDKLMPELELESHHIKTDGDMSTSRSGVYAAGDCTGTPYQLAKAVGEGQIAALNAASYVRKLKRKKTSS